ncbi:MAG: PHP domain-containing protein [Acidobacteria bacterium]|nr:PHP domain-containing protein [Acidobacteriota bacterium]
MLKVELHSHTADDPEDVIPYTSRELIDRAAELGYQALAITLHNRQLDSGTLRAYAKDRRIVLIRGVERTIEGKHVLLLNFPSAAERVNSFEELAALKRRANGLVVAPHPFFPVWHCLRSVLNRHVDLFDAVEHAAFYTRTCNFNRPAVRWAARHGKPLVGNGDVHRLVQLGRTYSLVDAPPDADAIGEAIRNGRVTVVSEPISYAEAVMQALDMTTSGFFKPWRRAGLTEGVDEPSLTLSNE